MLNQINQGINATNSVYTIALWIKGNNFLGNRTFFGGTTNKYAPNMRIDNAGHPSFVVSGSMTYHTADAVLNLGEWYHIAMVLNGSYGAIYVNGVLDKENSSLSYPAAWDTTGHLIGARNKTPEKFFNGTIDEITIYNRTLSAGEIEKLAKLGLGKYYWQVNISNGTNSDISDVWEFDLIP